MKARYKYNEKNLDFYRKYNNKVFDIIDSQVTINMVGNNGKDRCVWSLEDLELIKERYFKKDRIMNCSFCNKEFLFKNKNKIFCSKECAFKSFKLKKPHKIKEYGKRYYLKTKDKKQEYQKVWRKRHPEKTKEYSKKAYAKNKLKIIECAKRYIKNNKERVYERNKLWQFKNPDKVKLFRRRTIIKISNKCKENPIFLLNYSIRKKIKYHLKNKLNDNRNIDKVLNYNMFDLKKHLEKSFTPEMSWDNYGKYWQIDHIFPLSKCKSLEDIKECWSFNNLRPLKKEENMEKHDKIIVDLIPKYFLERGLDVEYNK